MTVKESILLFGRFVWFSRSEDGPSAPRTETLSLDGVGST